MDPPADTSFGADVGGEAVGQKRRRRGWSDPGPPPTSIGVPSTAWWCSTVPPLGASVFLTWLGSIWRR